MRYKINLNLKEIKLEDISLETPRIINRLLGKNNKWHDLIVKPYTCSLICGGIKKEENIIFEEKAFVYFNTKDVEVENAIFSNVGIDFSIEKPKVFIGYNLLSVQKVIYNTKGKKNWITEENKNNFIEYVKNKYCVDIEILKIQNTSVTYKDDSKIPVSNLLIRCNSEKNVANLFESGIGGSCSIGFGFVEPIKK